MKYRIGQILTANQDIEEQAAIAETPKVIPRGAKGVVGVDRYLHHFVKSIAILPFSEDAEIEGYDAAGLAEYIFNYLDSGYTGFPMDEMLDNYDIDKNEFIDCISFALEEIGFY